LAARFEAGGHADLALDTLQQALCVDPADADLRSRLARAFMTTDARASGIPAAIAREPQRLLALAAALVQSGRVDEGLALLRDMVKTDVERRRDVATLAIDIAVHLPDVGFHLTALVAGADIAEANWHDAAVVLQSFVAAVPGYLPALARLADVAAAGGLEGTLSMARVQLADAYLAAGMGAEAQVIVQDLVAREPWEGAHIERFRQALILSGEADADIAMAQRLSGISPFASVDVTIDEDPSVITTSDDASILMTEAFGVDEPPLEEAPRRMGLVAPTDDLEHVFARLRDEAVRRSELEEAAEESYRSGLALCDAGQGDAAIPLLEAAAQSPRLRFVAAAHAGRLHRDRGALSRAIEWFERATEAPAPDVTEGRILLYDLAVALESSGEVARALAVCIELQSEAGSYRDIADRIDRLARVQVGG
jgi:tetratricopeptide (TPR) repeat protein